MYTSMMMTMENNKKKQQTVVLACGLRTRSDMYARSIAATAPLVPHNIISRYIEKLTNRLVTSLTMPPQFDYQNNS